MSAGDGREGPGGRESVGPVGGGAWTPGRRSNGLRAAVWAAVGEIDPRQAGDLLTALAAAGIAAYVIPSGGSVGAYLSTRLPDRPLDRLHVDASRRLDAVALVRAELSAERTPTAEDEVFAAIVAAWDSPGSSPGAWPAPEDAPSDPPSGDERPPGQDSTGPAAMVVRPARRRADDAGRDAGPGAASAAGDQAEEPPDDEHYVPPPPPPLPRWQRPTLIAVLALLAGVGVLLWGSLRGGGSSDLVLLTGVLLIAGGTAGLISRLRAQDEPEGEDDGAVV